MFAVVYLEDMRVYPQLVKIGQEFGQLTVLEQAENNKSGGRRWVVRCACGREKVVNQAELRNGDTTSCGCLKRERARALGKANTKHGESWQGNKTPEYETWKGMIQRCHNPHYHHYCFWGGRGIRVCDRWRESFEAFLEDVGRRPTPKHSLDRIKNDRDYEPGNVRWTTWKVQANNRRKRLGTVTVQEKRRLLREVGWSRWGKGDPEMWVILGGVPVQLESAWRRYRLRKYHSDQREKIEKVNNVHQSEMNRCLTVGGDATLFQKERSH